MLRVDDGNLVYFREPRQLGERGLTWATFSRRGGASSGAFKSLNVGYHVGDDSQSVTTNRALAASVLSFPPDHIVAAQQVHGDTIAVVDSSHRGRGSRSWEDALLQTDAMITRARQVYLMLVVADCAVLTFFDPAKRVVGVAHCGWKGMMARLGEKTVKEMGTAFGCRPEDMTLIVSPSIGPCCYEVGELVLAPLRAEFTAWQSFVREAEGKTHLDLWQMARWQALSCGLEERNIYVAEMCTACNTDLFYSHRAEKGNTGRFGVIAGLG